MWYSWYRDYQILSQGWSRRGQLPPLSIGMAFWALPGHTGLFINQHHQILLLMGLLTVYSLPSLYLCLGLPKLRCRILHLALFNFLRFLQAHVSSLSSSLWMTSLPSNVLIILHSLVSSTKSLKVHLLPLPMSTRNILNCAGPSTNS